jgi:murein DD-endopeptidase MepM/ murein hydrolase activator NlpD
MKNRFLLFTLLYLLTLYLCSCAVSKNPERTAIRDLEYGRVKEDTSFVYHLPYAEGTSHLLAQGYFSRFSHKERAALDFKMKRGTPVYAARGGVVIRAKQDGNRGGWNKKYRPDGNVVVIQHEDGSKAGYWHLQHNSLLVKVGDTVKQDQQIALSGKTGYALFPHLHFIVWRNSVKGQWNQVATRFQTRSGDKYLRPGKSYKKILPES